MRDIKIEKRKMRFILSLNEADSKKKNYNNNKKQEGEVRFESRTKFVCERAKWSSIFFWKNNFLFVYTVTLRIIGIVFNST